MFVFDDPHNADGAPTPGAFGAALAAAVDEVLALDGDSSSDGELAEAMVVLRREQARLAAAVAELTRVFDTRRIYAEDGSLSATDWIATRTRLPHRQIAAEVRVARRLTLMPTVRARWRAGQLNEAHARRLGGLAANSHTAAHYPDGEPVLTHAAATMRFDDFTRTADHWRDAADPDGPEQRRDRDHQLRRFALPTGLDGIGHPTGYLTSLATATVAGALERIERELFEDDWADARAVHGDATTATHLARTPAQRRHDALVEMATRATTNPAHGRRPAPLISVLVGYETFAGRVCELAGGPVIAPGDITALLAHDDTLIERAVFDGPNRIIDISTARTFRGTLRRVLQLKHPRCTHPTCRVPSAHCQGDHIIAWSNGGLTTPDNGQPRCGPHNRHRHHHPDTDPAPPGAAPHPNDTRPRTTIDPAPGTPPAHPRRQPLSRRPRARRRRRSRHRH